MEFSQIALLLSVAAVFGIVARYLKQPLLIGYLFAGLLLASLGLVEPSTSLESLSQIGVTLLLFLLGLEMKLNELPTIGKTALITGLGQILFTSLIGYLISITLGYGVLPSIYIAIALTFSSTIIMVKLLSEKNDLSSLYGRISIGFLLVQDIVAVIILMFLSSISTGSTSPITYLVLLVKAVTLLFGVWLLSTKFLPKIYYKLVGNSVELNYIVSIAWALGVSALVAGPFGFTLEIGGFLAGLALSNLPEHLQIASRTRPLRDFFLTIFFLLLGTKLVIEGSILSVLPQSITLALFVLIGNPIIVLIIMGLLRYKKRTSFLAGLTVAQISEFSLILMAMGYGLGHVGKTEMATVVIVGVITMTVSTYMIYKADKLFKILKNKLSIFERKKTSEQVFLEDTEAKDHVILVGCDRSGKSIISYLKNKEIPCIVVDFNPRIHKQLTAENIPVVFGDIEDEEVVASTNLKDAKIVISTIGNLEANLTLIEHINQVKEKPATVFISHTKDEAIKLYEKGADYVIVPENTAGEYIKHLLKIPGMGKKRFNKMGESHFKRILQK